MNSLFLKYKLLNHNDLKQTAATRQLCMAKKNEIPRAAFVDGNVLRKLVGGFEDNILAFVRKLFTLADCLKKIKVYLIIMPDL
jgi:hypothetical protein